MPLYLKKITLTFAFFLILVSISFLVTEKGLEYYYQSSYEKFNDMFSENDKSYDVLLLGSSRTHRNIDVRICDSICQLSFYNAGISGAGGYEMLTSLKGFLQSHPKPKFVILNIDAGILNIDRVFFNPNLYLMNLDNDAIYSSMELKNYPVFLYKHLPFFKFIEFNDDMRIDALRGLLGRKETIFMHYNGYLAPYEKSMPLDTLNSKVVTTVFNDTNFQYVDSIVRICRKNHINICFINSPSYTNCYKKIFSNYSTALNKINTDYCQRYNIKMLDFDTLNMNSNYDYFLDNIHLNKKGTQMYSTYLANSLKSNCFK